MSLKLYYDLMSQPSRALYILLKTVKCNFEPKYVDLRKAEHYSEEFLKVNRFARVPVIDHNGFILTESVAILKYLSRENIIPDSLFPKDSKQQARVDEYLEWQHTNLRLHCAMFFRRAYLDPMMSGTAPVKKVVDAYAQRMLNTLEDFNTNWLGQGHDFIVGNNPTVADLLAACELEQPRMAGFDPKDKFPNIAAWWVRVRNHFNPHYDEGHVTVNKIIQKNKKTVSKI